VLLFSQTIKNSKDAKDRYTSLQLDEEYILGKGVYIDSVEST
jgi:hypothetical protein